MISNSLLRKNIRFETIDIAKAFAIVLVVIGHFQDTRMPLGYDILREVIYLFHMPLFMFASGFLYQATYKPISYSTHVWKKFQRLMVPYFSVSIIILIIKLSTQDFLPVEHPVTFRSFYEIFYYPSAGYFLWFIWSLFWMMVIIPLFKTGWSRMALLAGSVIIYFFADFFPSIFCLNKTAYMLVFFAGGAVTADIMKNNGVPAFSGLWQLLSVILFAILASYMVLTHGATDLMSTGEMILKLLCHFSGIAMSITLAYQWKLRVSGPLLRITYSVASVSYIIYLWHTTFEGFAKGILNKFHWFDLSPHLFTAWSGAIFIICCGVIIPWFLGKKVFTKWKITGFIFGVSASKKGK